MTIKEFIIKAPFKLNLQDADRISKVAELMYDEELHNKESVFARRESDNLNYSRRYETFFKLINDAEDLAELNFIKNVIIYAGLRHKGVEDIEVKNKIITYNPEMYISIFGVDNEPKGSIWNS